MTNDKKDCIANAWRLVTGTDWPFVGEFKFHPTRKFRFDWAHPPTMLAIEIEGGTWTGGRHSRGAGVEKDCEKYNLAAINGWRLIRLTPQMVKRDPVGCVEVLIEAGAIIKRKEKL